MDFRPMTTEEEWNWFAARTHTIFCADTQGLIAYDERGIQAMAVFDSWTVDACNVHFTIVNPIAIRRGFLHEIARHLFEANGRKRIFGLVPDNNEKALKLDKHIGMVEVTRVPDAICEGVGYVVMRMNKEDCRWLRQPMKEEVAA